MERPVRLGGSVSAAQRQTTADDAISHIRRRIRSDAQGPGVDFHGQWASVASGSKPDERHSSVEPAERSDFSGLCTGGDSIAKNRIMVAGKSRSLLGNCEP